MQLVIDRFRGSRDINSILYGDYAYSYEMYKCTGPGTPLHEAAQEGRPEVARMLLDRGADMNLLNSLGQTALAVAESSGNHAVLEVLRRERSLLRAAL